MSKNGAGSRQNPSVCSVFGKMSHCHEALSHCLEMLGPHVEILSHFFRENFSLYWLLGSFVFSTLGFLRMELCLTSVRSSVHCSSVILRAVGLQRGGHVAFNKSPTICNELFSSFQLRSTFLFLFSPLVHCAFETESVNVSVAAWKRHSGDVRQSEWSLGLQTNFLNCDSYRTVQSVNQTTCGK